MRKIAITGGICSGKSVACAYIQSKGYPVFSCDAISKELFANKTFDAPLKKEFSECFIGETLDRKKLAESIFSNTDKRKKLNEITHPVIMKELCNRMKNVDAKVVFAEIPLLFEGGYGSYFDEIFVILRDKELRISDMQKRDNISSAQALARIHAQFDYEKIENVLTSNMHLIKNNLDIASLEDELDKALKCVENGLA